MEWVERTIGEICDTGGGEVKTGPFGSQLHKSDYEKSGIPVVMPKDIVDGQILEDSIARVSVNHVERLSHHKLSEGDIVYGRRGDIGRQALVRHKNSGWLCGTGCLRVTLGAKTQLNSKFLHLYLKQPDVIGWIANQAVGATMPNLNTSILKRVPIKYPKDVDYQEKLVEILLNYDNLIENNNHRIAILEDMAQSLYREWFVHFRFPGHQDCQFKDSELGRIPEGWEVGTIGDLFSVKSGFAFKSKEMGNDISDYAIVKIKNINEAGLDIENIQYIREEFVGDKALRFRLKQSDVLIAMTGAQVGKVSFVPKTEKALLLNQRVGLFSQDKEWLGFSFLWQTVNNDYFQKEVINRAQGAAQPNISATDLQVISMNLPGKCVIQMYEELCDPMYEEVMLLQSKNSILKKQRDMLLPKLISGKINL